MAQDYSDTGKQADDPPPTGSSELLPTIRYTSDGGAFVTAYSEKMAGGATGFMTLKTLAKDGTITYAPSSGITVAPVDTTTGVTDDTTAFCGATKCAGAGTVWSPPVQEFSAALGAVQVTVQDLPVAATQLGP